jgi:subtilisin-like proprotein convertase family protein
MRITRWMILLALSLMVAATVAAQNYNFACATNCTALIPDGHGSLISTLEVPVDWSSGTLNDLMVRVSLKHDWVGDLRLILTHVDSGRSAVLLQPTDCPWDDIGTSTATVVFSSAAPPSPPCQFLIPAYSGTIRPVEPLNVFGGTSIAGTWVLKVEDTSPEGTGALESWGLVVTPVQPAAVSVSPTKSSVTATAGNPVYHHITVRNRGSFPDSFRMAITGGTFMTTVWPLRVAVGPLDGGASQVITIKVDVPPDAAPGAKSVSSFVVTSMRDATKSATATLTTSVPKPKRN